MNEIGYGRRELSDWDVATALEWRVSNGAGGSASGTVGGALAHRDHGLLIVPRGGDGPPVLRLAKLIERVVIDGVERPLDTNAWASGARTRRTPPSRDVPPRGLGAGVVVGIGDTRLEKRVWMEPGEPTTYVQYHLGSGHGPVRLVLGALANGREARVLGAARVSARTEPYVDAVRATWDDDPDALWLSVPGAEITERPSGIATSDSRATPRTGGGARRAPADRRVLDRADPGPRGHAGGEHPSPRDG